MMSGSSNVPAVQNRPSAPQVIAAAGDRAQKRFWEFFTVNIRNPNTRAAYFRAVNRFFAWCEGRGAQLHQVEPMIVAAYVEELTQVYSAPSVKQQLAAIRMLYDWFVVGQVVPYNPASAVRGPKHVVKKGKTPVLDPTDARRLLDSIDASHVVGLRDRALIGVMTFSFARVSAALAMNVEDYFETGGRRMMLRLHEKGGKEHEVPAHHSVEEYLDAYLEAAELVDEPKAALFQTTRGRTRLLTGRRLTRQAALFMIKRRCEDAGISVKVCNHTFRATGITAFMDNGGSLEDAAAIAGHESTRTTQLYDRSRDGITLDEIERIRI